MILYDFACEGGHRFEAALPSMFSDDPDCECGEAAHRVPSRLNIGGMSSPGPSRDDMPMTWNATQQGNPDLLRGWHKQMTRREKLEEKYPELAGDRRPVLAHEGRFSGSPLRAGDELAPAVAQAAFGGSATTKGDAAAAGEQTKTGRTGKKED